MVMSHFLRYLKSGPGISPYTTHGTGIGLPPQIEPRSTTPGLIGSPMAVPWSVWDRMNWTEATFQHVVPEPPVWGNGYPESPVRSLRSYS